MKNKKIKLRIGDMILKVTLVPDSEVSKANARIQKKVQPIFAKIKRTRKSAEITASKIILNF